MEAGATAPKRRRNPKRKRGAKTAAERRSIDRELARELRGAARRQAAIGVLSQDQLERREKRWAAKLEEFTSEDDNP